MAMNERSPLAAYSMQTGAAPAGNPTVYYDDQGRLQYGSAPAPAPAPMRSSNFLWRNNGASDPQIRSRWTFLPWSWNREPKVATAPVTRTRYDDYTVMPGLGYREFPAAQQTVVTQRRVALPPSGNEQVVVEEMKIYDMHPPWWWLFIIIGILLIVLGVLNILWCLDGHYYCRFWTGVLLIIFGILGAIHRGDYYKNKWKSWLYIIFGIITAAAVYACISFDLDDFCHQLIEIAQFNDNNAYINEMEFRYSYLGITPMYTINNNMAINIWVCFAIDGVALILLTLGFLVVTSVIYVINNFYNSNWIITRLIEPFYAPCVFNPWGQASLGQAMIYVGMVLNASVHGNNIINWQSIYGPVWAGVFPLIAGVFTALSLKSCGLHHRCWEILSIILELISAIVSIIALILVFVGMIQNVQTLQQSWVMNYTGFAQRMMIASTFLYCIAVIVCLANVIYSIVLLIRLIYCLCCSKAQDIQVQYVYDDPAVVPLQQNVVTSEQVMTPKSYGGLWTRNVPRAQFVDAIDANPYQAGRTYTVQ